MDATVGAGGHAEGILKASAPDGQLIGFDLDPQALALASQRLSSFAGRYTLLQASYTTLQSSLQAHGWSAVDGILLDLGVSSMELDTPERGFSFLNDGPLDMRFSPTAPTTAADLVNHLSEAELADLLWRYGEEQQSRRIARAIVNARPLVSTRQLADLIRSLFPGPSRLHPATRTFQALRIAVNNELDGLQATLPQAVELLAPAGRLAIISFHSLEDRIVKQFLRREASNCICPPEQPVCTCNHRATLQIITKHAIIPSAAEISQNPRSRSAKLRIAEKLTA